MAMSWSDASEITLGLILSKRLSINSIRPDLFQQPYSEIISVMEKNPAISIEELISLCGLSPIQAAIDAAKNVNGLGSSNWPKILETSYTSYSVGNKLEKLGRKLQQGDVVDWSVVAQLSQHAQEGAGENIRPLSDIQASEIPFVETGFKAIDTHLGGLPAIGQVVIAASPGVGKTSTAINLSSCFAKKHPDKNVIIFTLEMLASEIKMRFKDIGNLSSEDEKRILIDDSILTPEEVIGRAATISNLGLVTIDFADLLIQGATDESAMAHIYRTFMLGAKKLNCPVVLLSQLSRTYTNGIPKPNNIRYTSMAEALAWMILMLYNPSTGWQENDSESPLPMAKNKAYMIAWKVRGGFRKHLNESPGAIQIPFRGELGWNTNVDGQWFNLNKL